MAENLKEFFAIEQGRFDVLEAKLPKAGRKILKQTSAHIVKEGNRAFRLQRSGDIRWPPRFVPNIAGMLGDLSEAPRVKERRFEPRPALVDRGELRRANTFQILSDKLAVVGNEKEYAEKHHLGLQSIIQITETIRNNAFIYLRKLKGTSGRVVRTSESGVAELADRIKEETDRSGRTAGAAFAKSLSDRGLFTKKQVSQAKRINRKSAAGSRYALVAGRLVAAIRLPRYVVTVPERPWFSVTEQDRQIIRQIAEKAFTG